MKTVNLLPRWYRQQQRRQKNTRVHLAVMVALGAAMVAGIFVSQRKVNGLLAQRDALTGVVHQVGNPQPELERMKTTLQRLQEVRMARRELGNTIPMSAVIQQLQNEMTAGMALSDVSIEVHSEPVRGSGFVGDPRNPPRYHDVAQLHVNGIAPNDVQIAQFIEKLSTNRLFGDVTLDFTRTGELQRYPVRKFEIHLSMDLERLTAEMPAAPLASGDAHGQ